MILYERERANPRNGIYHQWDTDIEFGQHLHDSFEFVYLYEGVLAITVDGRQFILEGGQGLLLFPNQIHAYHTPDHSRSYVCIFEKSLVGEFYRNIKGLVAQTPIFPIQPPKIVEHLSHCGDNRYHLKACLYELVHQFEQHTAYERRNTKRLEHLGQILNFIADHHTESITMQDVARAIGYDHHYLSNLVQKGLGTTFRTLLNEYRISHAQYLLMSGQDTVVSIADACGYDSLCSFNRNFKEITGTTPTAYRNGTQDHKAAVRN